MPYFPWWAPHHHSSAPLHKPRHRPSPAAYPHSSRSQYRCSWYTPLYSGRLRHKFGCQCKPRQFRGHRRFPAEPRCLLLLLRSATNHWRSLAELHRNTLLLPVPLPDTRHSKRGPVGKQCQVTKPFPRLPPHTHIRPSDYTLLPPSGSTGHPGATGFQLQDSLSRRRRPSIRTLLHPKQCSQGQMRSVQSRCRKRFSRCFFPNM